MYGSRSIQQCGSQANLVYFKREKLNIRVPTATTRKKLARTRANGTNQLHMVLDEDLIKDQSKPHPSLGKQLLHNPLFSDLSGIGVRVQLE